MSHAGSQEIALTSRMALSLIFTGKFRFLQGGCRFALLRRWLHLCFPFWKDIF